MQGVKTKTVMPKHTTRIPTNPCRDFYEWYSYINGDCPPSVRARIDKNGNRRTAENDEQKFRQLLQSFANSLIGL